MEPVPFGGATEPRLDRPLRAVLAVALFLPLAGVAVAYHDGLIDLDSAQAYENEESYRFKGEVTATGGEDVFQYFDLKDDAATRRILWNVTGLEIGRTYVVVATYDADLDSLIGDSVARVFFFR